jgi:hypothetical protein
MGSAISPLGTISTQFDNRSILYSCNSIVLILVFNNVNRHTGMIPQKLLLLEQVLRGTTQETQANASTH